MLFDLIPAYSVIKNQALKQESDHPTLLEVTLTDYFLNLWVFAKAKKARFTKATLALLGFNVNLLLFTGIMRVQLTNDIM